MKTTFIYALRDPRDGEIRYVGKSNDPSLRLHNHISSAVHPRTPVNQWVAEITAAGLLPTVEVLEEIEWEMWPEAERRWIAQYSEQLRNVMPGGGSLAIRRRALSVSYTSIRIPRELLKDIDREHSRYEKALGAKISRNAIIAILIREALAARTAAAKEGK
jgi:hypothetical protein